MDDEDPIPEKKIYMVDEHNSAPCIHEDEKVGHMDPTNSKTPTSHEWDYKDNKIGIDDAMIPQVDIKNDDLPTIACIC
jgi:hypothetical protein